VDLPAIELGATLRYTGNRLSPGWRL